MSRTARYVGIVIGIVVFVWLVGWTQAGVPLELMS